MSTYHAVLADRESFGSAAEHAIQVQENVMSTNKDQVKGRIKEAKGNVKEVTGRILGDKTMENKGKLQHAVGNAQATYGDTKADIAKAAK
jgi:uncharacterized protein YjbJ (UPF0337 family)